MLVIQHSIESLRNGERNVKRIKTLIQHVAAFFAPLRKVMSESPQRDKVFDEVPCACLFYVEVKGQRQDVGAIKPENGDLQKEYHPDWEEPNEDITFNEGKLYSHRTASASLTQSNRPDHTPERVDNVSGVLTKAQTAHPKFGLIHMVLRPTLFPLPRWCDVGSTPTF